MKKAAARQAYGAPTAARGWGEVKGGGADPEKVQKRATWLNNNVFVDNPVDDDAMAAMKELDASRAM